MTKSQTLAGRTAFVAGSGRSIGAGIARSLAARGARVVVNSRSTPDEAAGVAKDCTELSGQNCHVVVGDVSTEAGAAAVVEETRERVQRVDVLVNAVGVSPRVSFWDMTFDDWRQVFAINVDSSFLLSRGFAPAMVDANWGRIVNISGHAYLTLEGVGVHTKASKAAVVGLTRGMAGVLAGHGITVNHVAPSHIDTPKRRNKYYRDGDVDWSPEARGVGRIPVGRLGRPEEVGSLIAFLASEDAAYLTGQTYLVNGGLAAL